MTMDGAAVDRYLRRIGVSPQVGRADLALLATLQAAHMIAVPFENLHVVHGRGVRTDVEWSYSKIVEGRRGGWCFELNGCFGALLRAIGFEVDHVSCRVWGGESAEYGPDLDHLALVVRLDGSRFLVDVGFGDNCMVPVLLESGESPGVPRPTRIGVDGERFTLAELVPPAEGGDWQPQVMGTFVARTLDEFTPRSQFLQTDPSSFFTQKPFATRALDATGSRVTLRTNVLRTRAVAGGWQDRTVDEPGEWAQLLEQHFGLVDSKP